MRYNCGEAAIAHAWRSRSALSACVAERAPMQCSERLGNMPRRKGARGAEAAASL